MHLLHGKVQFCQLLHLLDLEHISVLSLFFLNLVLLMRFLLVLLHHHEHYSAYIRHYLNYLSHMQLLNPTLENHLTLYHLLTETLHLHHQGSESNPVCYLQYVHRGIIVQQYYQICHYLNLADMKIWLTRLMLFGLS